MPGYSVHRYPTRSQALDTVAKALTTALEAALQEHGRVTVGVCGGRSADELFPLLAASPLPWASVDILLVDERWVPTQSSESNEKLVRDSLLQDRASVANTSTVGGPAYPSSSKPTASVAPRPARTREDSRANPVATASPPSTESAR